MTAAETYERYEAIMNKIENREFDGLEELKDLRRQWDEAIKGIIPEVGRGCTEILYSDRKACTITTVYSERRIGVRHNQYKVVNWEKGQCEIYDELEGGELIFTKRKNGCWVEEGQRTSPYSVLLMLHYQHSYIDPHF